jgi:RNA polymerase sigma factor (sigma-70 family)
MNEFSRIDIEKIKEEARSKKGEYLALSTWDLIFRVIEIKLKQMRIKYTLSHVEELRNIVFVRLMTNNYRRILKFDPNISSFKNWIFLIVNNAIIDEINKENGIFGNITIVGIQLNDEEVRHWISETIISEKLNQKQMIEIIKKYLPLIKPNYHLAIKLFYFDGYKKEICETAMGVSEKNFFTILSRARESLKKIIKKKQPELFEM